MELITFISCILATWRLSMVITEEEGPFSIFARLRSRFPQNSWFGRGIYCFWCTSFWFGIVLGIATTPTLYGIIYGLAFSTSAILMNLLVDWFRQRM